MMPVYGKNATVLGDATRLGTVPFAPIKYVAQINLAPFGSA